jgi:hypothetical protein
MSHFKKRAHFRKDLFGAIDMFPLNKPSIWLPVPGLENSLRRQSTTKGVRKPTFTGNHNRKNSAYLVAKPMHFLNRFR